MSNHAGVDCSGVNAPSLTKRHACNFRSNVGGMARPRVINPTGDTRKVSVVISEAVARDLEREAKRRKVSVGAIMRERLQKVA